MMVEGPRVNDNLEDLQEKEAIHRASDTLLHPCIYDNRDAHNQ